MEGEFDFNEQFNYFIYVIKILEIFLLTLPGKDPIKYVIKREILMKFNWFLDTKFFYRK